MRKDNPNPLSLSKPLKTLVQNETGNSVKPQIIVKGDGTELDNQKAIKGRAKRKMITQKMALSLIDIAKTKKKDERIKAYWNTYHCQERMYSAGGKLYGNYCKNRFCTLCCSIRKAEIINTYLPVIKNWEEPYFVTLTIKACSGKSLKKMIKGIIRAFKRINGKYRKRNQRGKGIKLIGIKSLECNFNPKARTYNPHLHLIVANKEIAETLIDEWLQIWTKKFTSRLAQHKRKVEDRERDLIEIVKYGSKIFTEPDVNKKSKQKGSRNIHVSALDNIFEAMKGCRIFERFGFNLPETARKKAGKFTKLSQYQKWYYDPKKNDWINSESEQALSGYIPPHDLVSLLDYNIEVLLE
ncbi:MAG: protein rep [Cytophagaceae bacterium]